MNDECLETAPIPQEQSDRRRDPDAHQAILDAALELARDVGYSQVTIEAIAAAAGVGKSTIYRWWDSKASLLLEALGHALHREPIPDSGDTRTDLIAIVQQTETFYVGDDSPRMVIAGLLGEMHHNPQLANDLRDRFIHPRRACYRSALERAQERGDLPPGSDLDVLLDILVAPISYRALMTGVPIPDDIATRLVDVVLGEAR